MGVLSILSRYQTLREGERDRVVRELFFSPYIVLAAVFEGKRLVAFSIGQQLWSLEEGRKFIIKGPYHSESTPSPEIVTVLKEKCESHLRMLVDSKDDAGIPFVVDLIPVEPIINVVPLTA